MRKLFAFILVALLVAGCVQAPKATASPTAVPTLEPTATPGPTPESTPYPTPKSTPEPTVKLSGPVPVTGCLQIREQGTYLLQDHIASTDLAPCIEIFSSNTVFDCRGLTINFSRRDARSDNNFSAISVFLASNVTVKNCFSQNFKYGIHVQNSSTVTLSGNTLFNDMRGSFGVYLNDSHDCLVSGNVLKRHPFGTGLGMEGSYGNNVTLNYVDLNLVGFYVAGSRNNDFFFNNVSRSYLAAVHLFTGSESNRFVENQFIAGFKQIEGNTGLLIQGAKGTELRGNSLCANVNDIICTSAGIASAEGNFCNTSSPACGFSCTPCTGRYVIPGWDVLP